MILRSKNLFRYVTPGEMTSTNSGAKISMFGTKSGFVIPKNKLSGSLIPIFQRGNKTLGGTDTVNGLASKLGKRKTKWGPDLSQDIGVKKARVLAYQVSYGVDFFSSENL